MKFELKLKSVPIGIAAKTSRPGESNHVITRDVTTSRDGTLLFDRLEDFPNYLLDQIRLQHQKIVQAQFIGNLVAIFDRLGNATVQINDIDISYIATTNEEVKAGNIVFRHQIKDIREVKLHGAEIKNNEGFLVVFSFNWRKALCFDFTPIAPGETKERNYDLGKYFAGVFNQLVFDEYFKISEDIWTKLLKRSWFPFRHLGEELLKELILYTREDWPLTDLLPKLIEKTKYETCRLRDRLNHFEHISADQRSSLIAAINQYQNDDALSSLHILVPRLEGVMRDIHRHFGDDSRITQNNLARIATGRDEESRLRESPLLPKRFNQYLSEVFFANFDPDDHQISVSRNSIAHGVATVEKCNMESASIGMQILLQLVSYFE